jgi:hypothetical protein
MYVHIRISRYMYSKYTMSIHACTHLVELEAAKAEGDVAVGRAGEVEVVEARRILERKRLRAQPQPPLCLLDICVYVHVYVCR